LNVLNTKNPQIGVSTSILSDHAREFAEHGVVRLPDALSTETIDNLKSISTSLYARADEV
jgi:hypothetical protein